MTHSVRLPTEVLRALAPVAGRWQLVNGAKHVKLLIDGYQAVVISRGKGFRDFDVPRNTQNTVRGINRCIRMLKEQADAVAR